jgi:hypothetical protein
MHDTDDQIAWYDFDWDPNKLEDLPSPESFIDDYLIRAFAKMAQGPIQHAHQSGAFPQSPCGYGLRGESLLVVPDTNVLLRDIAYACGHNQRTTSSPPQIVGPYACSAPNTSSMRSLNTLKAGRSAKAYLTTYTERAGLTSICH